jgi:putative tryptophan/tyrosine transport system substrate-binding protein
VITGDCETDSEVQVRIGAFQNRLAELGWIERRTIRFDFRWGANDIGRIQTTAADLVNLRPDAILSMGTPVTVALQRQISTVPIVFALVADPVASGLVESLARPGANHHRLHKL